MVGLVLVSHGGMAEGMREAISMITGQTEQIAAFGLYEEDSPEELTEKIREQLPALDSGDGVVFFVDLFGASPFNACARLLLENQQKYALICGMNLPMLLEISLQRDSLNLQESAETALAQGKEAVTQFLPAGLSND